MNYSDLILTDEFMIKSRLQQAHRGVLDEDCILLSFKDSVIRLCKTYKDSPIIMKYIQICIKEDYNEYSDWFDKMVILL